MILTDNETKVDLLNNEAIAKTIIELLREKPGDPLASNLVRLILLPSDDDEVMPPTGKGTLTPDEVLHLVRWIQQGAHFPGHSAAATKPAAPEK